MDEFLTGIENGWGLDAVLWFQSWRTPFISALFAPFNFLGTELGILLVLPLVYWCVNKSFGRRLVAVILLSSWVNLWFKNLWARPRPFMIEGGGVVPAFDYHDSYGLPSGHTMLASTALGYTALRWGKIRGYLVSLAVIFLMAVSRLVHGVHYPQDVISGFMLSVIILAVFSLIEKNAGSFFMKLPVSLQILTGLGAGLVMIIVFRLSPADQSGIADCSALGALAAGAALGIAFESRFVRFSSGGSFLKKTLRFLTGIAGLMVLYAGLRFPAYALLDYFKESTILEIVLKFIRYSALGLWVSWGAPLIFKKTGIDGSDR